VRLPSVQLPSCQDAKWTARGMSWLPIHSGHDRASPIEAVVASHEARERVEPARRIEHRCADLALERKVELTIEQGLGIDEVLELLAVKVVEGLADQVEPATGWVVDLGIQPCAQIA
jgi:hypothetical protein